jgi:hypothetical protein
LALSFDSPLPPWQRGFVFATAFPDYSLRLGGCQVAGREPLVLQGEQDAGMEDSW